MGWWVFHQIDSHIYPERENLSWEIASIWPVDKYVVISLINDRCVTMQFTACGASQGQ